MLGSFSNSNPKFIETWQLQSECWRSNLLSDPLVAWKQECFSQRPEFTYRYFFTQYLLLNSNDGNTSYSWNPNIIISYFASIIVQNFDYQLLELSNVGKYETEKFKHQILSIQILRKRLNL